MSVIEKTNAQLTLDVSTIKGVTNVISTKTLANISSASIVGLKDGSGSNGDMILASDSSIYIKLNGLWKYIPCASLNLGT